MSFTAMRPTVNDVHADVKAQPAACCGARLPQVRVASPAMGFGDLADTAASPTLGLTQPAVRGHAHRRERVDQPVSTSRSCACPGYSDYRSSRRSPRTSTTSARSTGTGSLRVRGKGRKVVLVPLPPAVSLAVDRAAEEHPAGPLLLNRRGVRMDRHMLRHTLVTTMLDAPSRTAPSPPTSQCPTCGRQPS